MVEPTAVFSRNELKATDEDNDGASLASVTVTVIIFGTEKTIAGKDCKLISGIALIIQRIGKGNLSVIIDSEFIAAAGQRVGIVVFSGSLPTAVATTEFKEDASLILKSWTAKDGASLSLTT